MFSSFSVAQQLAAFPQCGCCLQAQRSSCTRERDNHRIKSHPLGLIYVLDTICEKPKEGPARLITYATLSHCIHSLPKMRRPLHSLLDHCNKISAGRKTCAVHSAFLPQGRGRSSHLLSVQSNLVPQGLRQHSYLTFKLPPLWKFITAFFNALSHPPSFLHSHAFVLLAFFFWL